MEPMLKSTVHGPFDSVHQGKMDNYEKKDKNGGRSTLKKLDNRDRINESVVVPMDRAISGSEDGKLRERAITTTKHEKNKSQLDSSADFRRNNTPSIQINPPR